MKPTLHEKSIAPQRPKAKICEARAAPVAQYAYQSLTQQIGLLR